MPKQIQTISIQKSEHGWKFMVENYECNPQFFFCRSNIEFDDVSGFNQYCITYCAPFYELQITPLYVFISILYEISTKTIHKCHIFYAKYQKWSHLAVMIGITMIRHDQQNSIFYCSSLVCLRKLCFFGIYCVILLCVLIENSAKIVAYNFYIILCQFHVLV